MPDYGYAGEILKVDLSTRKTATLATADYASRFLGGRGIAAKIYWDETSPETRADDPENPLIFITGPVSGFTGFSGCRWQICGKSAEMDPEAFSYANLGGSWGAWLKYAGYDGLVVSGKAEKPVYIYIDEGKVEVRDAAYLRGTTTVETERILQSELGKSARVACIGPAGENRVAFANVLAAENASGSSGFGSVMGSKNIKAIVVKADEKKRPAAADPEKLKSLQQWVKRLRDGSFEDYGHLLPLKMRFVACYGCISGCTRGSYEAENGYKFKSLCQAAGVYAMYAMKYCGAKGMEVGRLATRLCDMYGLDTIVMSPLIGWLAQCYQAGILSDEETGLPLSKIGSAEFIETLVNKLCTREGFGDILARGTIKAAAYVGKGSEKFITSGIITSASEGRDYDPRLFLMNAMLYATEPRRPIQLLHAIALPLSRWSNWRDGWKNAYLNTELFMDIARRQWGSAVAGDLTTYTGKALASQKIQAYGYIKESMILCDLVWPMYHVNPPDSTIGPFTVESRILSAITGREPDEAELEKAGERLFNMQRAVLMRQGWGGRAGDNLMGYLFRDPAGGIHILRDWVVPGKDGVPVSIMGAVMDKDEFEKLKDEYYSLAGWDVATGLQTRARMAELNLPDIAAELEKRNLLK